MSKESFGGVRDSAVLHTLPLSGSLNSRTYGYAPLHPNSASCRTSHICKPLYAIWRL